MHNPVPYRDLKPGTVFMFEGNPIHWVKIDNGKARVLHGETTTLVSTTRKVTPLVEVAEPKKESLQGKYREALLLIGAQHPINDSNKSFEVFINGLLAMAREAVGAVGVDDDDKADWCAQEHERLKGEQPRTLSKVWAVAWEPGPASVSDSGGHDWYVDSYKAHERFKHGCDEDKAWKGDKVVLVEVTLDPPMSHAPGRTNITEHLDKLLSDLSNLDATCVKVLSYRPPASASASGGTETGWQIARDAQYAYIRHKGKPGCIQVKLEREGFVVDIFNHVEEVVASAAAEFADLGEEVSEGYSTLAERARDRQAATCESQLSAQAKHIRHVMRSLHGDDVVDVLLVGGGGIWNATVGESDDPAVLVLENREPARVGVTQVHADAIVAITKFINLPKEG